MQRRVPDSNINISVPHTNPDPDEKRNYNALNSTPRTILNVYDERQLTNNMV